MMWSLDPTPGQSSTCTARAAHPMGLPFLSSMCSELLHAVSTSPSVADVLMSGPKWNRYTSRNGTAGRRSRLPGQPGTNLGASDI
eukprot:scaffold23652_cov69-Phaeocystis_antarctica.AAC.1